MKSIKLLIWLEVVVLVAIAFVKIGDYQREQNNTKKDRIVQENIGHPIKYRNVPVGHYHVVAVIEPHTGDAVIRSDENLQDLFVTEMMPQMMEKGYFFTVGGNAK